MYKIREVTLEQALAAYNRLRAYVSPIPPYLFLNSNEELVTELGRIYPEHFIMEQIQAALESPKLTPQAIWEAIHIYHIAVEVYDKFAKEFKAL